MDETWLSPWLDLVVTHCIEPRIGDQALFVFDFPPAQAALARLRRDAAPVAERFELYFGGTELANGFQELADAAEQRSRFEADNRLRVIVRLDHDDLLDAVRQAARHLADRFPHVGSHTVQVDTGTKLDVNATIVLFGRRSNPVAPDVAPVYDLNGAA